MSALEEHVKKGKVHAAVNTWYMYQRRVWSQMLHSKFTNHTRPYRVTQHYCDYTTCFSCGHFHGAAEAATLDLFRPPVSESDAVSPVCHTVKLNPRPQQTTVFNMAPGILAALPA